MQTHAAIHTLNDIFLPVVLPNTVHDLWVSSPRGSPLSDSPYFSGAYDLLYTYAKWNEMIIYQRITINWQIITEDHNPQVLQLVHMKWELVLQSLQTHALQSTSLHVGWMQCEVLSTLHSGHILYLHLPMLLLWPGFQYTLRTNASKKNPLIP